MFMERDAKNVYTFVLSKIKVQANSKNTPPNDTDYSCHIKVAVAV